VLAAGCIRGRSAVVVKMWRAPGGLVRAAVSRPENLELQNGSLPLAAASPWPCYSAPLQRGLQVGDSFTGHGGRAIAVAHGCGCGTLDVRLSHAHSLHWRSSSAPKGSSAGGRHPMASHCRTRTSESFAMPAYNMATLQHCNTAINL
jgi:hypothetical protein